MNLLGQVVAEYIAGVAAALTVTAVACLARKRRSRRIRPGREDST
ncbi:hypothetical protein [Streptomyces prunicolor]|nr:hypothetical protein [Streptomyces prunicolor]